MEKIKYESSIGESYIKAVHQSGLNIYIMEKPRYSSAYAVFGTKYGSIDTVFSKNGGEEISVPEGIAHFLEHKLFESEEGDAFTRYAETGGYANAFTSFDRTCYLFSCSDRFYDNLAILLDFVQHPYFTAKTVEKEQGIIGQEIRMYDDSPAWRVLFNMLLEMYYEHPVRIDIAGTTESIAEITDKLLYECYDTFYNPANMFICVAGNVSAEKIASMVNEYIIDKEPVNVIRGTVNEPETVRSNYIEQKLEVSVPMFCLGFKDICKQPEKTAKERIAMGVTLEVLAGDCSPLYKELIDAELINDDFETEYFTGNGYAAVMFSGESEKPKEVKSRIIAEINRLLENGIDSDLLNTVKCAMYGDVLRRFNSCENISSQMAECAMFGYSLFEEQDIIASVNTDDVINCLSALKEDKSVLSVINPM